MIDEIFSHSLTHFQPGSCGFHLRLPVFFVVVEIKNQYTLPSCRWQRNNRVVRARIAPGCVYFD